VFNTVIVVVVVVVVFVVFVVVDNSGPRRMRIGR
jgi:hypothetical protein